MNNDKKATWIGFVGAVIFAALFTWKFFEPSLEADTAIEQAKNLTTQGQDTIDKLAYLAMSLYSLVMGRLTNKPDNVIKFPTNNGQKAA